MFNSEIEPEYKKRRKFIEKNAIEGFVEFISGMIKQGYLINEDSIAPEDLKRLSESYINNNYMDRDTATDE